MDHLKIRVFAVKGHPITVKIKLMLTYPISLSKKHRGTVKSQLTLLFIKNVDPEN